MADRLLLESGSPDGYLLEDGSGVLLMQVPADDAPDVFVRVGTTANIAAPLFTVGVHPATNLLTVSLGTPTVVVSSSVSPATQLLTVSLGTPSAGVNGGASPTGFSVTASLGTPTETASSSVSPTGYGLTASQTAPTEQASSTVSPTGFGTTASLGTPSETVSSSVSPTGFGLTASLGTPIASGGTNGTATPTGLEATMGLGTPTVTGDAAAPPPVVQGEPIGTRWQRRPLRTPRVIQEPDEAAPVVVDAVVRVTGFQLRSMVGTTWQVADAAIAPQGFQVYAQSNRAKATGMHNPTDAQIVDWLLQALAESV